VLFFVLYSENVRRDVQKGPQIRKSFFSLLLLFIPSQPLYAMQTGTIQTNRVIVLFEKRLRATEEVTDIYPMLKMELEDTLGWRLGLRPTLLLIKDRKTFEGVAGSKLIVALAIPQENVIVIDYSRMNTRPFSLEITLKHELFHLLLNHHIGGANLPKWLNEGISMWMGDGLAEIIMDRKRSVLDEATLWGNYVSINRLTTSFPKEKKSLLLAYEESKSLVEYISNQFGRNGVLNKLKYLKDGYQVDMAILKGLSIPFDELEKRWHSHLRKRSTWFTYLPINLYEILFFLAVGIDNHVGIFVWAFIRLLMKKNELGGS